MGYSTASLLAALLSLALVSHGSPADPVLTASSPGITVAEFQSSLLGLGYDPGPISGQMDPETLMAAASFATQYGVSSKKTIVAEAASRFQQTTTSPRRWSPALTLNAQVWLQRWHLYSGPLSGRLNQATQKALVAFLKQMGLSTKSFTARDLRLLMHLETIRLAYNNHWVYRAEPGDSLSQIAFSINMPGSQLQALNPEHQGVLWVNQVVKWSGLPKTTTNPSPRTNTTSHHSSTPPSSASTTSAPITTGVLSNIRPVAALVILNPTTRQLQDLIQSQERTKKPIPTLDVSLSGQWALLHASLVKTVVRLGDEVDISGYSGTSLVTLPPSAIGQELTWARRAFGDVLGTVPSFLVGSYTPSAALTAKASALGFIPMSPTVILRKGSTKLNQTLLAHPEGIVVVTGAAIPRHFLALFKRLATQHFVFLNLGQIWAQQ